MKSMFESLYVFEMANNHQGSVDHGLRIIREVAKVARRHGVKAAVKFQYRDLETLIHPAFISRKDVPHIPRFVSTRLTDNDFRLMVEAVREEGLIPIATPFDEPSVERCMNHGVEILKIASASAKDWPLLDVVVQTKKPVIVSTGGMDVYDIDNVVSFFTHRGTLFALLHCVGVYPAPASVLHLNFLDRLSNRYPSISVGYSGHESPEDLETVAIAVAKGATILERHVGIPTESAKLNAYSLSPEQLDRWVEAAERARVKCGDSSSKRISEEEIASLRSLMRGVFAKRPISCGNVITRADVFFAMPCQEGQLTAGEFGRYRATYVASRDYASLEPIMEHAVCDAITLLRGIVHDVRGMLYEAHIEVGRKVQIEISHHKGIENFRSVGASIVNVINRSYCKKLIIMFPGQRHPSHAHKTKDETFQLLWGDLEVTIEGTSHVLQPGDILSVEPGQFHSFATVSGAIFEEVSTTHQRDDSVYEDPVINARDPMARKTILDDW